jgi:hypothetical protein
VDCKFLTNLGQYGSSSAAIRGHGAVSNCTASNGRLDLEGSSHGLMTVIPAFSRWNQGVLYEERVDCSLSLWSGDILRDRRHNMDTGLKTRSV